MSKGLFVTPRRTKKKKQPPWLKKTEKHGKFSLRGLFTTPMSSRVHSINVTTMFFRFLLVGMLQIVAFIFEALLIMGQGVFWKLNSVSLWYTNTGNNEFDIFQLVWVSTFYGLWFASVWWCVGLTDIMGWT